MTEDKKISIVGLKTDEKLDKGVTYTLANDDKKGPAVAIYATASPSYYCQFYRTPEDVVKLITHIGNAGIEVFGEDTMSQAWMTWASFLTDQKEAREKAAKAAAEQTDVVDISSDVGKLIGVAAD